MSEDVKTDEHVVEKVAVLKFGGSSVADAERMKEVANIIGGYQSRGYLLAVIVSAMGNTTNDLLALAQDVSDDFDGREIDQLLATGEQQSIALLALAL
jgi:aspartate kinase